MSLGGRARGNSRRSLVGGATCRKTPISRSALDKILMPGHLFEDNPFDEGTTLTQENNPESSPNSKGGLIPFRSLSGLQEIPVDTQEESISRTGAPGEGQTDKCDVSPMVWGQLYLNFSFQLLELILSIGTRWQSWCNTETLKTKRSLFLSFSCSGQGWWAT